MSRASRRVVAQAREATTTEDDQAPCPATTGVHDEALDRWPTDTDDSRFTNLSDIIAFGPHFNKVPSDPAYSPRFDLNASGAVNLSDVVMFGPHFNKVSPNSAYSARFEHHASNSVNLSDIVALGPFFNRSCA